MVVRPKCERATKYILPTIRGLIAKELVEEHGFSQSHAAKVLGITQAAVSQYISSKRGGKLTKKLLANKEIIKIIGSEAGKIADAKKSKKVEVDLCGICTLVFTLIK
ncbi:MAG: Fis family transcriptional regulator [Nitrososphaeria archaeon]|jgi:predicted transcriptional regulator